MSRFIREEKHIDKVTASCRSQSAAVCQMCVCVCVCVSACVYCGVCMQVGVTCWYLLFVVAFSKRINSEKKLIIPGMAQREDNKGGLCSNNDIPSLMSAY